VAEQLEILRRIAERGLRLAQREAPSMVDLWQHMLDEIERTRLVMDQGLGIAPR
jgi:hypothetical protein